MLMEKGADIHVKSKNEATSLHDASLKGHAETAMMLIEKGADIL